MNIWYIADTHFYHKNIIEYCNRPFKSLEEMNLVMVRNWNSRVKKDDTIFIVGDFIFTNSPGGKPGEGQKVNVSEFTLQLNGNKVFIEGNHDCFSESTRLLTAKGYKSYQDLKLGEFIPTLNLHTNKVEMQPISDIIINPVTKIYGFKDHTSE